MTTKQKSSLPMTFEETKSVIYVAYDRGLKDQPAGVVMNFAFGLGLCIFKIDATLARKVGEQLIEAADAADNRNTAKCKRAKVRVGKYPRCRACKGTSFVHDRVCTDCEGMGENRKAKR